MLFEVVEEATSNIVSADHEYRLYSNGQGFCNTSAMVPFNLEGYNRRRPSARHIWGQVVPVLSADVGLHEVFNPPSWLTLALSN